MDQKRLQLNFIVPTVHTDGTNLFISVDGDIPTLNFFQVRQEDETTLYADVVASVRFVGIEQLKSLQQIIEDTVQSHTQREA